MAGGPLCYDTGWRALCISDCYTILPPQNPVLDDGGKGWPPPLGPCHKVWNESGTPWQNLMISSDYNLCGIPRNYKRGKAMKNVCKIIVIEFNNLQRISCNSICTMSFRTHSHSRSGLYDRISCRSHRRHRGCIVRTDHTFCRYQNQMEVGLPPSVDRPTVLLSEMVCFIN